MGGDENEMLDLARAAITELAPERPARSGVPPKQGG